MKQVSRWILDTYISFLDFNAPADNIYVAFPRINAIVYRSNTSEEKEQFGDDTLQEFIYRVAKT